MFATLVMSAVPDHLRGYASRFMLEPAANVFVGNLSAKVAERLWMRIERAIGTGWAVLVITASARESGYDIRTIGVTDRSIVELDGMQLAVRRVRVATGHERKLLASPDAHSAG